MPLKPVVLDLDTVVLTYGLRSGEYGLFQVTHRGIDEFVVRASDWREPVDIQSDLMGEVMDHYSRDVSTTKALIWGRITIDSERRIIIGTHTYRSLLSPPQSDELRERVDKVKELLREYLQDHEIYESPP